MEKTVVYRKKEEYMAESGERIEIWTKHGKVTMQIDPKVEQEEVVENFEQEKIIYGVMMVMTQMGPKEIRFSIPNAKTIEEAFGVFPQAVQEVLEELEKQRDEAMRETQSQIVQAPAGAMDQINRQLGQTENNSKIHIP